MSPAQIFGKPEVAQFYYCSPSDSSTGVQQQVTATYKFMLLSGAGTLVLLYFVVRFPGLNDWYYSYDDTLVLLRLLRSEELLKKFWFLVCQYHPPLTYILLYPLTHFATSRIALTSIAWLPILLCLPIFYLLGGKVGGTVSRSVMVIIPVLGYLPVILSQIPRGYGLCLFLISSMLLAYLEYWKTPRPKALICYFVSAGLLVMTNYAAFLPITALGVMLTGRAATLQGQTSGFCRLRVMLLLHLLLGAGCVLAAVVLFLPGSSGHQTLIAGNMQPFLAYEGATSLALSTLKLFGGFFFHPKSSYYFCLLIPGIIGGSSFGRKKRWDVIGALVILLLLNIPLQYLEIYPLSSTRHCYYLLPFVSLLIARGCNSVICTISNRLLSASLVLILVYCVAINISSGAGNLFDIDQLRYGARHYFKLKRTDTKNAQEFLANSIGAEDLIVRGRQFLFNERLERRLGTSTADIRHSAILTLPFDITLSGVRYFHVTMGFRAAKKKMRELINQEATRRPFKRIWLFGVWHFRNESEVRAILKKRGAAVDEVYNTETFSVVSLSRIP